MMNVVVKSSLLVIIAIISFILFEGFWTLCFLNSNHVNSQKFIISEQLLSIDCIINQLCLMLQFHFMNKHYYTMCNKFHITCFNCCYHQQTSNQLKNMNINVASVKSSSIDILPVSPTISNNPSLMS